MGVGTGGALFFTQNNWGREEQFIGTLPDEVRLFDPGRRLRLEDEVEREITQRILEYDPDAGMLYLVRLGEKDDEPGLLQIIDPAAGRVTGRVPLGLTPTDLVFDRERIYASNFDSGNVTVIDKESLATETLETGPGPLRLCISAGKVYLVEHMGGEIRELSGSGIAEMIPFDGSPDNVFDWNGRPVVSTHSAGEFTLAAFDPGSGSFETLIRSGYPYGDTSFDTNNVSFYVRGQYGDAVLDITKAATGTDGALRVIDFLSGRFFVITAD
jgi:DNA-binding beta-propeller fold protein YncE